jgi:ABC-type glycerol-3-phosphate transport system permease component
MTTLAVPDTGSFSSGWQGGSARLVATLLLLLIALASLAPFLFLVAASFRPTINGGPGSLWVQLTSQMPVLTYMLNSAMVSIGTAVLVLLVSSMAGYGFAKLGYAGRDTLFVLLIASISIPMATTILPNYLNFAKIGAINTLWGPILLYAAGATPFATVLMASYFRGIPDEIMESAVVDGANYRQIYTSIMVRMAGPAFVTVGVLVFLGAWNDLLIGMLFLPNIGMRTISVGVAALQNARASDANILLTGSLVSAIPPVIAFMLCQRYLVAGLTAGMIK